MRALPASAQLALRRTIVFTLALRRALSRPADSGGDRHVECGGGLAAGEPGGEGGEQLLAPLEPLRRKPRPPGEPDEACRAQREGCGGLFGAHAALHRRQRSGLDIAAVAGDRKLRAARPACGDKGADAGAGCCFFERRAGADFVEQAAARFGVGGVAQALGGAEAEAETRRRLGGSGAVAERPPQRGAGLRREPARALADQPAALGPADRRRWADAEPRRDLAAR